MVWDANETFLMILNWFYVPRFSGLEQDYARLENVEYKKHLCSWIPYNSTEMQKETEERCRHVCVVGIDLLDVEWKVVKNAMNHLYASKKRLSCAK